MTAVLSLADKVLSENELGSDIFEAVKVIKETNSPGSGATADALFTAWSNIGTRETRRQEALSNLNSAMEQINENLAKGHSLDNAMTGSVRAAAHELDKMQNAIDSSLNHYHNIADIAKSLIDASNSE